MSGRRASHLLLSTLTVLLALPAASRAQLPGSSPHPGDEGQWLEESRRVARDAFEARRADPKELARAKLAAAREAFRFLEGGFRFSRALPAAYIADWSERLLKARLAVAPTAADRLAAFEHHWLWAVRVEEAAEADHRTGRVGTLELLSARVDRLDAEIAWARARKGAAAGAARVPVWPVPDPGTEDELEGARRIARAKAEALGQTEKDLTEAKVRAARGVVEEYLRAIRTGKVIIGPSPLGRQTFLSSLKRWLEAERAVRGKAADPAAFAEGLWELAEGAYEVSTGQYEVGKIGRLELAAAAYFLHDAELRWLQALSAKSKGPARERPPSLFAVQWEFPHELVDYVQTHRARAKFAVMQRRPAELIRGKLEAVRTLVALYLDQFAVGKIGPDGPDLREWWPRLLEAEFAVAALGKRQDWLPILEAHWRSLRDIERVFQFRSETGRDGPDAHLLAVYDRLDAQLAWLRALAARKAK